uniref:Uncharacterized protein n=1 Tax=Rhipicephalus zambeziensis TaxID=60191 RepID=A0A224Y7W8_9ACAR
MKSWADSRQSRHRIIMQLSYACASFFSSIVILFGNGGLLCTDASHWMYLEKVAEEYIHHMNKSYSGGIASWGMTRNYTYWRTRKHTRKFASLPSR